MTKIVELEVAQATLSELIAGLKHDEEIEIVHNEKPIARIALPKSGSPQFGNCRGMLTIVSEDNEHLKAFEKYTP